MLYRERLSVPLLWWVLAAGFVLSLALAIGLYLGPIWGIGAATAGVVAAAVLFIRAGILIVVDHQALWIGRAQIDHPYIAGCRALDAEATRRRSGVEADARAHLVLRPYVATAVEITLADPADPVPYWLVSSRRPDKLTAALSAAGGRASPENDTADRGREIRPRLTE
jgi:hypothetical protein